MDASTILILAGFLLFILVLLAAVRYTSADLTDTPEGGKTSRRAKPHRKPTGLEETRRWLRFLVVIAAALAPLQAICMALHVLKVIPYQNSIPILIPTLGGVLAVALARWGSFRELGVEGRTQRSALLSALLVVNGANLAVYTNLAVTLLALCVFIALMWMLGLRAGDRFIASTGLLVMIWFALYLSGALYSLIPPTSQSLSFVLYLVNTIFGVLTVLLPALLLHLILSTEERMTVFYLRLFSGLALLSIAVYVSYHGAAITSLKPYLAASEFYPFTQLMTTVIGGGLLAVWLDKRQHLYGPAFAILVSLLLITASSLGRSDTTLAVIQNFINNLTDLTGF